MKYITTIVSKLFVLSVMLVLTSKAASASLEPMQSQEFDEFYIAESIQLSPRRTVFIEEVPVSFSKVWLNEFSNETSSSYRQYIKKTYGVEFKSQMQKSLSEAGWKVLTERDKANIIVQPKLDELNIVAPEKIGISDTILARFAGSSVINIVISSGAGDTLMTISDYGTTPATIGSPFANRRTNFIYFKLLLNNWAQLSSTYLDSLMEEIEKQAQ
ncbi:hypothetical protein KO507_02405 [Gilvimarinus agarilyticus]|uniref:hypothetical protein n=1 Tax=Gilvimarinus sp. 2_MG-2023 TaxID=3062666 RepID=UPI001C08D841|nr:hypothetical protein [Gilvimarinus sp. 2_MG-2023]MBU2884611.1 hypothetical protein [Gilvimarinus agarilyticus]MDO6569720.1 hypothetical protein [Gilvimarinus sp. 2_MG-2023]